MGGFSVSFIFKMKVRLMKKDIYTSKFTKKDRKVLIEGTKTGFKQFLLEVDGGEDMIARAKANPDMPIYLTGIIQKGDAPNRNGRIYPFEILKKECERYLNEEIREGQSFLELDHPENSTVPELKNAAATLEDIWFKGTEVWGRVKLLNAFMPENASGKLARGIVLNGKTLGISSRALGSVYADKNGYDVVEEDLEIICWDLVSRPSTFNANLKITESKQLKGSLLTETKCLGGNCNIKTSREIIKEKKLHGLTTSEKVFVECMGVEKFLQMKIGRRGAIKEASKVLSDDLQKLVHYFKVWCTYVTRYDRASHQKADRLAKTFLAPYKIVRTEPGDEEGGYSYYDVNESTIKNSLFRQQIQQLAQEYIL